MEQQNWVCVYKTNKAFEAEAIKVNIEHQGIPCVIINKQDSSYLAFGLLEIHVPEENKTAAEAIINDYPKEEA